MFQNLHQIANHFFANPPDQRRTLGRNANHHLRRSSRATEVTYPRFSRRATKPLAAAVVYPLRNRRHSKDFLLVEEREKKNCTKETFPGAVLTETQQETALHLQNDMKAAPVRTNLSVEFVQTRSRLPYKAIKVKCAHDLSNRLTRELVNPRFEYRQFHLF
jgi:hypothetical protein